MEDVLNTENRGNVKQRDQTGKILELCNMERKDLIEWFWKPGPCGENQAFGFGRMGDGPGIDGCLEWDNGGRVWAGWQACSDSQCRAGGNSGRRAHGSRTDSHSSHKELTERQQSQEFPTAELSAHLHENSVYPRHDSAELSKRQAGRQGRRFQRPLRRSLETTVSRLAGMTNLETGRGRHPQVPLWGRHHGPTAAGSRSTATGTAFDGTTACAPAGTTGAAAWVLSRDNDRQEDGHRLPAGAIVDGGEVVL